MAKDSAITSEMRKTIGALSAPEFPGEEVTRWAILRYAAATEDPNPLWRDEDYARKSRWGGIVAPPTFAEVYSPLNRTMRETGGELVNLYAPFEPPFRRQVLAGEEFEFLVPIRPGDAISSRIVLGDICEGRSRSTSGRLVFMREDKEYRNQKSQLVSTVSWTRVFVESSPPPDPSPVRQIQERALRPAAVHPTQLYFEDVEEGMDIPLMEKRVTMTTIAKWAGATGDVAPPHLDPEFAQNEYGLPGVIAHGPLSAAYLAQLITNWIGAEGVLKKHSVRYQGNTRPKDIITFRGQVARKWVEQGEGMLECQTRAENQHGVVVTLGKSVASLPARHV